GLCLVYRAEIMHIRGAWQDALEEAARVLNVGAGERDPAERATCGAAWYQQGEVHRVRGEWSDAEFAYREASRLGREPQPGWALAESSDGSRRARLLPAAVEIALATGDIERAGEASRELDERAAAYDAALLDAQAAHARGAVALARGDALAALVALRQACDAWRTLDAPREEARTRVLIAHACRELGDADAARLELDAARRSFDRLGAVADLSALETGASSPSTAAANARRSGPHE